VITLASYRLDAISERDQLGDVAGVTPREFLATKISIKLV
jgi:hypothetical protein